MPLKIAARSKIEGAGVEPYPHDSWQQKNNRSTNKNAHVQATSVSRNSTFLMCYKWVCRKRKNFIEDKKHEKIARPRHCHCRMNSNGVKSRKPGLMLFMIAAHISNRIESSQNPKAGCNKTKNCTKRRYGKFDGKAFSYLRNK